MYYSIDLFIITGSTSISSGAMNSLPAEFQKGSTKQVKCTTIPSKIPFLAPVEKTKQESIFPIAESSEQVKCTTNLPLVSFPAPSVERENSENVSPVAANTDTPCDALYTTDINSKSFHKKIASIKTGKNYSCIYFF